MGSDMTVNPIDIMVVEQIHAIVGSPKAIPTDLGLLWYYCVTKFCMSFYRCDDLGAAGASREFLGQGQCDLSAECFNRAIDVPLGPVRGCHEVCDRREA